MFKNISSSPVSFAAGLNLGGGAREGMKYLLLPYFEKETQHLSLKPCCLPLLISPPSQTLLQPSP